MSVPAWRRSRSKLDAEFEAVKFRTIVTQMIMRNFGLKLDKNMKPWVSKNLRKQYPELKPFFDKIERKQEEVQRQGDLKQYDQWFLRKVRSRLYDYVADLVKFIAAANEIKCSFGFEYEERIRLQDKAISCLEDISQEVNFVEEHFDIDLNKYMNYAEQKGKCKRLLYKWKRSTVKQYEAWLKEEAEWEEAIHANYD